MLLHFYIIFCLFFGISLSINTTYFWVITDVRFFLINFNLFGLLSYNFLCHIPKVHIASDYVVNSDPSTFCTRFVCFFLLMKLSRASK